MPTLDRCICQAVVKVKKQDPRCPFVQGKYLLWFTDNPGPLTYRDNWKPDILNQLLDRVEFCSKLVTFNVRKINQFNRSKVSVG